MFIRNIAITNFRSLRRVALLDCGTLNVLIGRNNAGKSNFLAALELFFRHASGLRIAGPWVVQRPVDQFTNRESARCIRISVEFTLSATENESLRSWLQREAPHLEKSVEQLRNETALTVVLSAAAKTETPFLFIERIVVGGISTNTFECAGVELLHVSENVAAELFSFQQASAQVRNDLAIAERATSEPELQYYFDTERSPQMLRHALERGAGTRGSRAIWESSEPYSEARRRSKPFTKRHGTLRRTWRKKLSVLSSGRFQVS